MQAVTNNRDSNDPPLPPGSHIGLAGRVEKVVLAAQRGADKAQAEHAWLGFPYAVFKKYADDEGSRLAALITYYSFLSLFPMAIMFMFSLSVLFHDDPAARNAFVSEIVPAEYSGAVLSDRKSVV